MRIFVASSQCGVLAGCWVRTACREPPWILWAGGRDEVAAPFLVCFDVT